MLSSKMMRGKYRFLQNTYSAGIVAVSAVVAVVLVDLQQNQTVDEEQENKYEEIYTQRKLPPQSEFLFSPHVSMTTTLCESINKEFLHHQQRHQQRYSSMPPIQPKKSLTRDTIDLRIGRNFIADAAEIALPSVVHIHVEIPKQQQQQQSGNEKSSKEFGTGSGFVVNLNHDKSNNGNSDNSQTKKSKAAEKTIFIATNAHVLLTPKEFQARMKEQKIINNGSDNSDSYDKEGEESLLKHRIVLIRTHTNDELRGKILFVDVLTDLALVQVVLPTSRDSYDDKERIIPNLEQDQDEKLFPSINQSSIPPSAIIGTSSSLRHGEFVIALGSPLSLNNSCTMGIVSNPSRSMKDIMVPTATAVNHHPDNYCTNKNSNDQSQKRTEMTYIQTDASINVGNSGGPLINLDGEVVGMNSMKHPYGEGVGFAIPIDEVMKVLNGFLQR